METHELDIEIRPDGEVRVHVKGVKGAACMDYVKLFENILNTSAETDVTSEFYEAATEVSARVAQHVNTENQ